MTAFRTLALSALAPLLVAGALHAQDLSKYREFSLGSSVAAVTKVTGGSAEEIKVIHQRPAIIQELRWRPQRYGQSTGQTDPVREMAFSFYNDQLFLIVVDYDRQRIEGLTDGDVTESLTATYGPPVLVANSLRTRTPPAEPDGDVVVARWATNESSLTMLRGLYPASLRLVVAQKALEALARTASTDAARMDLHDAPQREVDRQKRVAEDSRIAGEKARVLNKPAFKP